MTYIPLRVGHDCFRLALVSVLVNLLYCGSLCAKEPMLHVVLAVDSKAEAVGDELTARNLMFVIGSSIPQERLRVRSIGPNPSDTISEKMIIDSIRNVPAGPDDAVMFLYVGHGEFMQNVGTYLTPSGTSGQFLSGNQLLKEVRSLNARLSVVMLDCCNRERAAASVDIVAPAPMVPKAISPLMESLFFKASGAVTIVSSSPGEYALVRARRDKDGVGDEVPSGPLFISAMGGAMVTSNEKQRNWFQLTADAQKILDRYYARMTGPQRMFELGSGEVVHQERQTIRLLIAP